MARQEKIVKSKDIRELAEEKVNNPNLHRGLLMNGFRPANGDYFTFDEAMQCSQISSALRGDLDAYNAVMKQMKEKKKSPLEQYLKDNGIYG